MKRDFLPLTGAMMGRVRAVDTVLTRCVCVFGGEEAVFSLSVVVDEQYILPVQNAPTRCILTERSLSSMKKLR